jgi:hypothetical protein
MTVESDDDILDDLFHGCALRAYLEMVAETGQSPPDSVATRQRAYDYYEEALAEKTRQKSERPERGEESGGHLRYPADRDAGDNRVPLVDKILSLR